MQITFAQKVHQIVSKIPKGKTLTYGEVAELAGSPGAFRAVGNSLNKNFDSKIPCPALSARTANLAAITAAGKTKSTF